MNDQSLDLEEYENYWKGPAYLSDKRARAIEEAAASDGSVADLLLWSRSNVHEVVREAPATVVASAKGFRDQMVSIMQDTEDAGEFGYGGDGWKQGRSPEDD